MAKKRKAAAPVDPPPKEESESEEEEQEEEEEGEEEVEEEEGSSEEEDEDSKRETLQGLLEPLTKDQLVDVIREAAAKSPSLVSGLVKSAESHPVHRKIFVHGLGWDTTTETLAAAFRPYGQIEECNAVLDRATGRCKGFGFVLFKNRAGARKALKEPQKKIGGRTASCQLASIGPGGPPPPEPSSGRKLYVANVSPHVRPDKLRDFFAKFGEIEEGPTGLDKATGKFRGFAIFLYRNSDGMKRAIEEPEKQFEGCKLMCSAFVEGRGSNKAAPAPTAPSGTLTALSSLSGLNPGPGAVFLGQTPGLGVFNPLIAYQRTVNPGYQVAAPASLGGNAADLMDRLSVQQHAADAIGPSVINAYGTRADLLGLDLQGLGAYQGRTMQSGQGSSATGSELAAARAQFGAPGSSPGPFHSNYGR